ncbi:hypothetical protein BAZG_00401 [Brucella sp. NVSL 07-0026]|nr:hypothetical protein BAZG_00401 [Brucella sp. NVSL 07-0026]
MIFQALSFGRDLRPTGAHLPGWRSICAVMGLTFTGCVFIQGSARAQDGNKATAVLELYTSQGCKSCPPADKNFAKYADDPNVLALSFHVNYWDYMGWRDTLATQDNTDRQNSYRNAFHAKMIYTPQAIINGAVEANGRNGAAINAKIAANKLDVPVSIQQLNDGRLSIDIGAGKKPRDPVHVVLFYFRDSATIPITEGENAGKAVTYRNTVSDIDTIGMWDGKPLKIELPASELKRKDVTGCAVILQETRSDNSLGPMHGAAMFKQKRPVSF